MERPNSKRGTGPMPSSGLNNSGAWNDACGVERMKGRLIERSSVPLAYGHGDTRRR